MDKTIILQEEFIPADKPKKETKINIECRRHIRLSLRLDADEDIVFACDGLTVPLIDKNHWIKNYIGLANIKDIGLGGVGFITRCSLRINQKIYITIDNEHAPITIMRVERINGKLSFIGAKWDIESEEKIIPILNKINKMSKP
ncbi:hypothetical protein TUM4438_31030 [Shewanella sairae]|uniref:PilZ domain-containing protein n=1 Tax=Shewanella sairae TaxID=190310 RepID=A0ABQ4PL90_9GAMM|nr:hypothetical protein [Shewanella sairae]MCL1130589.1 hypothetical protein [Shewanella sairae]GIU48804.1 hypothetical protein TUM4438_31030 [Shewanella sairae]